MDKKEKCISGREHSTDKLWCLESRSIGVHKETYSARVEKEFTSEKMGNKVRKFG